MRGAAGIEYRPGTGLAIVRGDIAILLTDAAAPRLIEQCYAALGAAGGLEAVLALLLHQGLYAAPDFAIIELPAATSARVLVRGTMAAQLRTESGAFEVREPRGIADRDIEGLHSVRLDVVHGSAGQDPAADRWLPLVDGIVRADAVRAQGRSQHIAGSESEHGGAAVPDAGHIPPQQYSDPAPEPSVSGAGAGAGPAAVVPDSVPDPAGGMITSIPFARRPAAGSTVSYPDVTDAAGPVAAEGPAPDDGLAPPPPTEPTEPGPADPDPSPETAAPADTDPADDGTVFRSMTVPHADDPDATIVRSVTDVASRHGQVVRAVVCPQGHLTPAEAPHCRICRAVVAIQEPVEVPRPTLGRLTISTGAVVDLDRDVFLGRAPRVPADHRGEQPHVIQLIDDSLEVSAQHLHIALDHWTVTAIDLGSTNGTEVTFEDGQRTALVAHEPMRIGPGSVIDLAGTISIGFEVEK